MALLYESLPWMEVPDFYRCLFWQGSLCLSVSRRMVMLMYFTSTSENFNLSSLPELPDVLEFSCADAENLVT